MNPGHEDSPSVRAHDEYEKEIATLRAENEELKANDPCIAVWAVVTKRRAEIAELKEQLGLKKQLDWFNEAKKAYAEVARLKALTLCGVCAGSPPVSGLTCICECGEGEAMTEPTKEEREAWHDLESFRCEGHPLLPLADGYIRLLAALMEAEFNFEHFGVQTSCLRDTYEYVEGIAVAEVQVPCGDERHDWDSTRWLKKAEEKMRGG